jgi:hypothetical protein
MEADGTFRTADTHEPGHYLVRPLNRKPSTTRAFAVNADPAESDPATIAPEALRARFGRTPLLVCDRPEALAAAIGGLREGISLRDGFLWAVLAALVLEVFLANRRAAWAPSIAPATATATALASASATAATPSAPLSAPSSVPVPLPAGDEVRDFLEHLEHEAAGREGGPP